MLNGLFHSPLYRAAEEAAAARARPEQWLGYLRNRPGVKREELDHSGLEEWLQGQNDIVTREALCDYLRAQKVQLVEVIYRDEAEGFGKWVCSRTRQAIERNYHWDDIAAIARREQYTDIADAAAAEDERALEQLFSDLEDLEEGNVLFPDVQLPGGRNYREIVIQVPPSLDWAELMLRRYADGRWLATLQMDPGSITGAGDSPAEAKAAVELLALSRLGKSRLFVGPHFLDCPNAVVHIRCNERLAEDGRRVLFVEEIQSDLHQSARRQGYRSGAVMPIGASIQTEPAGHFTVPDTLGRNWYTGSSREGAEQALARLLSGMRDPDPAKSDRYLFSARPELPFRKSWPMLALKRMLAIAAREGYDTLAWVNGGILDERFGRGPRFTRVEAQRIDDQGQHYRVVASNPAANQHIDRVCDPAELAELCGDKVARSLMLSAKTGTAIRVLEESDLQRLDMGFGRFYDEELVHKASDYLKPLGGSVTPVSMIVPADTNAGAPRRVEVHGVDLSDSLRMQLCESQPMFRRGYAREFSPVPLAQLPDSDTALAALRGRLADQFGRPLSDADLFECSASPAQEEIGRALASVFGKRIRFVGTSGEVPPFHGLTDPGGEEIYLHAASRFAVAAVFGHELLHQLRRRAPEDYQVLEEVTLRCARRSLPAGLQPAAREELVADVLGEQFMNQAFWTALRDENPGVWQQVIEFLRDALQRLQRSLKGEVLEGSDYVRQTAELRSAAVQMVRTFYVAPGAETPRPS